MTMSQHNLEILRNALGEAVNPAGLPATLALRPALQNSNLGPASTLGYRANNELQEQQLPYPLRT